MTEPTQYTAAEAAFVLRQSVRAVTRALERGPVRARLQLRSGVSVRMIDRIDLLYLLAVRGLRDDLTPKARGEFYLALRRDGSGGGDEVRFGRFRVAVADLIDDLRRRTADLADLKDKIALADDGTAMVDERQVEVHRIAALLNGGLSVNAVREEYPWLSHAAVETARAYAQVMPKAGRPYPRTTANRVGREID
jgi:uncharacterized protein (DUF433 family)